MVIIELLILLILLLLVLNFLLVTIELLREGLCCVDSVPTSCSTPFCTRCVDDDYIR